MCFSQAPAPGARSPQRLKFRERLRELGWVEGQNLVIEERWAENRYDRLPALMAEVIGRKVDVLVTYTTPAAKSGPSSNDAGLATRWLFQLI